MAITALAPSSFAFSIIRSIVPAGVFEDDRELRNLALAQRRNPPGDGLAEAHRPHHQTERDAKIPFHHVVRQLERGRDRKRVRHGGQYTAGALGVSTNCALRGTGNAD